MERKKRDVSTEASPYDLLGQLPLRRSEDRKAFFKLRHAIEEVLKPGNILEYAEVQDIALKFLEIGQLKRIQDGMRESPTALAEFLSIAFHDNELKAKNVALKYLNKGTGDSQQASDLMAEHGILEGQIETHAITSQMAEYRMLDQLVQYREFSSSKLIRRALNRLSNRDQQGAKSPTALAAAPRAISTVLPLEPKRG